MPAKRLIEATAQLNPRISTITPNEIKGKQGLAIIVAKEYYLCVQCNKYISPGDIASVRLTKMRGFVKETIFHDYCYAKFMRETRTGSFDPAKQYKANLSGNYYRGQARKKRLQSVSLSEPAQVRQNYNPTEES